MLKFVNFPQVQLKTSSGVNILLRGQQQQQQLSSAAGTNRDSVHPPAKTTHYHNEHLYDIIFVYSYVVRFRISVSDDTKGEVVKGVPVSPGRGGLGRRKLARDFLTDRCYAENCILTKRTSYK